MPDSWGRQTAEALDYAIHMLGLVDVDEILPVDDHSNLSDAHAALWAEATAATLAEWMHLHGVPQLKFWFPSRMAHDWVQFQLLAKAPA